MEQLQIMGQKAKEAARAIAGLSAQVKNTLLCNAADLLLAEQEEILAQNEKDVTKAEADGIKGAYIDRLTLNPKRITEIAEGMKQVAALEDPVGEILAMRKLPNGLMVGQRRVPMGVVGIIYESRPNVTADAFALCFKAGSAVVLRGGKEAFNTNMAIVKVFRNALKAQGLTENAVSLLEDTSRETAVKFMQLSDYIDLLIPRGGNALIQTVVKNSSIPVIETGIGNCHIFVDESADLDKALQIIINAKTQRPGVCNACEKLLIHSSLAEKFVPEICQALTERNVEIRGDEKVVSLFNLAKPATEDDWYTEYLDYIIGIKIVSGIDDALNHIAKYSSQHSEAIITENYTNSQRFLAEVDSACVYVNASTRFTDGFQFGFGAEIGISTSKLHARGPMGLKELTTLKYIIYGDGQIRE